MSCQQLSFGTGTLCIFRSLLTIAFLVPFEPPPTGSRHTMQIWSM